MPYLNVSKIRNIITILYSIICMLIMIGNAHALTPKIVARVNEHIITDGDIKHRYKMLSLLDDQGISLNNTVYHQIRQRLVHEHLVCDEAKKLGLSVSDQDLEEAKQIFSQHYKVDNLENFAKQNKILIQDLIDQFKIDLMWRQVLSKSVTNSVKSENHYIDQVVSHVAVPATQVVIKQAIIYNKNGNNEYKNGYKTLEQIATKLRGCKDFDNVVNSVDKTIEIRRDALNIQALHPSLANIVTSLPIGVSSNVIKQQDHIKIVMVCDRKIEQQYEQHIRNILFDKRSALYGGYYLSQLERQAIVEYF